MATDDILVDKSRDGLGISFSKGTSFWPFGEVINGDNDVTVSCESSREGSNHIYSYLMEWDRVLGDRIEGCFSFLVASFLTDFARLNVFGDILLHSRPVVLFCNLLVSVLLCLMSG